MTINPIIAVPNRGGRYEKTLNDVRIVTAYGAWFRSNVYLWNDILPSGKTVNDVLALVAISKDTLYGTIAMTNANGLYILCDNNNVTISEVAVMAWLK